MRKNELTDTKALDIKTLKGKVKTLAEELSEMMLQKNMNSLKDTKSVGKKRKDLAQILTIIAQKEYLALFEKTETETKEASK